MEDNNKNALSSLVDRVFAVCYTGYKDRHPHLMDELSRVGLRDKTTVIWQFPTPYNSFIAKRIPHIDFLDKHPGCWGAIWGQYEAIKTGYHLGLNRIMIVEDDCRFMKDLSAVEASLSELPAGWDVLMLDHFKIKGDSSLLLGGKWTSCRASASTACYIVNRKAMERLIAMYESPVSGKYVRPLMRNCDHWTDKKYLGGDIGFYVATPNLAVQCTCPGASNCGRLHCIGKYQELEISLDDYAGFSLHA